MKKQANTRHNVILYPGDMDTLKNIYPASASLIIRSLVRRHINEVRSGMHKKIDVDLENKDD